MSAIANVQSSSVIAEYEPLTAPEGKKVVEFHRQFAPGELPEYMTKMYHLLRISRIAGSVLQDYTLQKLVDDAPPQENKSARRISGEGGNDTARPQKLTDTPLSEIVPTPWPEWFTKYHRRQLMYNSQLTSENGQLRRRIQELESAILESKQEHRKVTAMSIYGSENVLEEVTRQVAIAPQFKDLTPDEHRFVAGVGLASGLNPIFHLHAWKQGKWNPDTRQKEETLHIVPDYKALIASSPDPIMTSERRLTKDEMAARGIPQNEIDEGAIAYEVTGSNLKHAIMARRAGIEYTPKKGFGWWSAMKDENDWKTDANGKKTKTSRRVPNDTPAGRDGEWVAKKRALRDLFNQIADLRLKFLSPGNGSVVDDEWIMSKVEEIDAPAPTTIEGTATIKRADWLNDAVRVQMAEAWATEKGVTDDMINAALDVPDWKNSQIEDAEFKALVENLAQKAQMESGVIEGEVVEETPDLKTMDDGEVVTVDVTPEPPAPSSPEPAESGQEADKPAAPMCASCGLEPADIDSPFPTLCKSCGTAEANRQAKATEKAAKTA